MSEFHSGNRFLNRDEMAVNATYIYRYLAPRGWSLNAICAMLGNMETESTINPAIWQNLDEGNTNLGYGLVQWTPATKYLDWCADRGLDDGHMISALQRIEYEVENGLQWITTDSFPLTFADFKVSNLDVTYLANAFLCNYERPADQDQPARGTQAAAWREYLSNGTPIEPDTPTPAPIKRKSMKLLFKYIATRR